MCQAKERGKPILTASYKCLVGAHVCLGVKVAEACETEVRLLDSTTLWEVIACRRSDDDDVVCGVASSECTRKGRGSRRNRLLGWNDGVDSSRRDMHLHCRPVLECGELERRGQAGRRRLFTFYITPRPCPFHLHIGASYRDL